MIVKKAGGKSYGAVFSKNERKAMNLEIGRQLVRLEAKYCNDFDYTVLWYLNNKYDFGLKRLKSFWMDFKTYRKQLMDFYEMGQGEDGWLFKKKLQDKYPEIDLEVWEREGEKMMEEAAEDGDKSSGV